MYEIIEKNKYGMLVRKIKSFPTECEKCKYTGLAVTLQPCKSCKADNSYYLPDSEAEKLESETSDTQKELIDLRCELRVEKEKSKALIKFLEDNIERCKEQENYSKSMAIAMSAENSGSMAIAYQNVLEFIKNQK